MKVLGLLGLCLFGAALAQAADDTRVLARLPAPAEANLREEMRDNLVALDRIFGLLASGSVKEAGDLAEKMLGQSAQGRHRGQPLEARPGPHMPEPMHALAQQGHKTASEFARVAATGDRDKALAAFTTVSGTCVACHQTFRVR